MHCHTPMKHICNKFSHNIPTIPCRHRNLLSFTNPCSFWGKISNHEAHFLQQVDKKTTEGILLLTSTHHHLQDLNFLCWAWLHCPLLLGYRCQCSILRCAGGGLEAEGRKGVPGGWFSLSQLAVCLGASFGLTARYTCRKYGPPWLLFLVHWVVHPLVPRGGGSTVGL